MFHLIKSVGAMNGDLGAAAFSHVDQIFLPRAAIALSSLWRHAKANKSHDLATALVFFVEQAIWTMALLNRYRPTGYSQVNQYMSGRIRILSQHAECSPWYILDGKASPTCSGFSRL